MVAVWDRETNEVTEWWGGEQHPISKERWWYGATNQSIIITPQDHIPHLIHQMLLAEHIKNISADIKRHKKSNRPMKDMVPIDRNNHMELMTVEDIKQVITEQNGGWRTKNQNRGRTAARYRS